MVKTKIIIIATVAFLFSCGNMSSKSQIEDSQKNLNAHIEIEQNRKIVEEQISKRNKDEEIYLLQVQEEIKNNQCNNNYNTLKNSLEQLLDVGKSKVFYVYENRIKKWNSNPIWLSEIERIKIDYNRDIEEITLEIYDNNNSFLTLPMDGNINNRKTIYLITKSLVKYLECKFNKNLYIEFDVRTPLAHFDNPEERMRFQKIIEKEYSDFEIPNY